MKKHILTAVVLLWTAWTGAGAGNTLWYGQPAVRWIEASPIGNGRLGAMVYGGIKKETLALNEISLWSGRPDSTANNLGGKERLAEIRQCFWDGNAEKGNQLAGQYLQGSGKSFGTHLPLGDLVMYLEYPEAPIRNYRRELDLDKGEAAVSFRCGDVTYRREYIADYPDNVIAVRLSADRPGAITATFGLSLLRMAKTAATDKGLTLEGTVDFTMHGPGGVNFCGEVRIVPEGGKTEALWKRVKVTGADAVTLLIDVRTDYRHADYRTRCSNNLDAACAKGFAELKKRHTADYTTLFGRMDIRLGDTSQDTLPTDTRLRLIQAGASDPGFDALFFQYGRYLLISSSRSNETGLCANLQGIWNDNLACHMSWTCDYHMDINTAQNYWSANRANLAECNEALFDFLGYLAKAGSETARKVYGCNGWVAHTVCNPWGYTAPGWGFTWGLHVTGGAWLATHLWSHYLYTRDDDYLRRTGYPLLKETARFFADYMATDPRKGYLVTGPSTSPENGFVSADGKHLFLSMMPTIDRSIVYEIYTACIEASRILRTDKDFRKRLEKDRAKLPPLMKGSDGQLQEWLEDVRRIDPSHRHSSHLLSLFPLGQISYTRTPDLLDAARKSLEAQTRHGLEDTEWSTANMQCYFARLKDGQRAYDWLQNLFRKFTRENLFTVSPAGVASARNDIFSFDASEASVAGVCEMLLQSYDGFVELLPALPAQWADGHAKGLCAEGGLVFDIAWKGGQLTEARVSATRDCTFRVKGFDESISLKKGESRTLKR